MPTISFLGAPLQLQHEGTLNRASLKCSSISSRPSKWEMGPKNKHCRDIGNKLWPCSGFHLFFSDMNRRTNRFLFGVWKTGWIKGSLAKFPFSDVDYLWKADSVWKSLDGDSRSWLSGWVASCETPWKKRGSKFHQEVGKTSCHFHKSRSQVIYSLLPHHWTAPTSR